MKVEKLVISGFRNLEDIEFSPGENVNVICGDNAQGKTNLIEAIWIFSGARSFRGSRDSEYIAFGKDLARLDLSFSAEGRSQTARLEFGGEQKTVLLNGIKMERAGALSGVLRTVVFSPDHLELVKQGPKNRRRLIDISLCQAYPKYEKILASYEKILKQRAFLLKDVDGHPQIADLLDVWDQSLIEYGGYITWMRARYVKKLALYAGECYEGISSGKESFSARYASGCGETQGIAERKDFEALFKKAVEDNRGQDLRLGQTCAGPHRDDMEIMVGEKSARSFGSQGQQRSCVLALKLAECRILEEGAQEPPVILLDDVMSELDKSRQEYLLGRLDNRQVFITCCDPGKLDKTGNVFFMESGRLSGGQVI